MATALKSPPSGMTGAVRSLQWSIQDMNGSVEHLGQSNDHLRRAQNLMAWTTAIFGALLLSGLVWIANDIFHLKDQMSETNRRFDNIEAQMTALGTRLDDVSLSIEQVGAELLASQGAGVGQATGAEVSALTTPGQTATLQTNVDPSLATASVDAAAQPAPAVPQVAAPVASPETQVLPAPTAPATTIVAASPAATQVAPAAPATATVAAAPGAEASADLPAVVPSPPAPRADLTPAELAQPSPVTIAAAPASEPAPAAAEQSATEASTSVAEAPASGPAAAAAPAASSSGPAADLSDDELLSYDDNQVDPADELLLLDENGNPQ